MCPTRADGMSCAIPSTMPSPARRIGTSVSFFPETWRPLIRSSGVSISTGSVARSLVASYAISMAISLTSCLKSRVLVSRSRRIESLCWMSGWWRTVRLGKGEGMGGNMRGGCGWWEGGDRSRHHRVWGLRLASISLLFRRSITNYEPLPPLQRPHPVSWLLGKPLTVNSVEEVRAPKWHRRPDARRGEIIDRAVLVFGRKGYRRATLADVADGAGVCASTVSHYFGSKANLFEDVIAERLMPYVEAEEASLATHTGPMREILDQLLRRLWDRAWE